MSDTQVIVVSLAVGFGVGIALLMVLWACKACLGKPKTADDDNAATEAARVRQQRAATAEAAVTAQQVNVQLPAAPERPARDPSAASLSPKVQRSHPPAAINFPNEAIAPSPNLSVPSPEPCPTAPSPFGAKGTPTVALPSGPMAFASPSPLPTRLSNHGMQVADTPSPQPAKPPTVDSSTSAASSMVTATPIQGGTSNALTPAALPAAALSTTSSSHHPAAAPTLAQLDPTVPSPTPMSGLLSGAGPQDTVLSPLPSGVTTQPSDVSAHPTSVAAGDDGVPVLDLDPINQARAKLHNANPRTYADPASSAIGTTAELGPLSEVSGAPNTLSNAAGSYRMPQPLQTVSATQSLEHQQAQAMAAEAATHNDSSKPAPSIESHQITEEPSTAVSDAAVTIGGLTMREMVDAPQPINDSDGSYTAMLEQATGVEAVEGTASFVTAEGEDSPGTEKSPGAAEQQASTGRKSAEIVDKGDMRNVPVSPSGTALLAHYEEQDDQDDDDEEDFESVGTPYTGTPYSGLDTTRTVGAQSLAFMEGGQRYHHRPEARFVPDVSDLEGGERGCHNDAEPLDLPPGAVMRGRDPLMDHLMSSKLSQELPEGFSRTTSCEMATPGGPGGYSVTQSPMGTPGASALGGSSFSGMGGDQASKMSFPDNYRYIPDSNHDSLLSIPINPAQGYPGETETPGHSVAISEASEWTLSAPTRAMGGPSSVMSRGGSAAPSRRYVPGYADSMMSGMSTAFSEASDWTLSGGNTRQMPALRGVGGASHRSMRHGISPMPSPSTRSQLGKSNGLTAGLSSRSDASNWTLSGNTGKVGGPSQRFSQASRVFDDGKSIAFTDGGSEWALSPRTVARDDSVLDVGHSERWMQPDDIKMPARPAPQSSKTRGLREKYEQKTLRQKYAADDTNVPEYAVRRVNDWMGAMEGDSRDEVMLRLTAQQNGF